MKLFLGVILVILWLPVDWVSSQKLEQNPQSLSIQEGEKAVLTCDYTNYSPEVFQWYRQNLGRSLVFLQLIRENEGEKQTGRLRATFDKTIKQSSLYITKSQPADSATYVCAAGGYENLIFGTGTQLLISPNVKEPDPAVYQLGGSKSNQISVCLFTDFDSETNVQEPQGPAVISLNSTVLDMKVMNSKSNAALAWGNSTDFKCNGTFNEKFFSSSDFSCDATLIAKNFETDMNLNFHNLIVIGLRILLLKVAGFNLFMTLRLWSR